MEVETHDIKSEDSRSALANIARHRVDVCGCGYCPRPGDKHSRCEEHCACSRWIRRWFRMEGVYKILTKKGYNVTVVQNPTISLAGDVAVTKRAIDAQDGPVILVGHSYGGAVISQAGTDPNVVGLVYITAFALDNGESVGSLLKNPPPGSTPPPILPPQDGFLLLDREKFPAAFAGDVKPETAAFMAASQVPWGLEALNGVVTDAAWKTKPSWYLITTEDRMIPPDAQRFMSKRAGSKVVEVQASHSVFLSKPDAVASIIEQAADGSRSM